MNRERYIALAIVLLLALGFVSLHLYEKRSEQRREQQKQYEFCVNDAATHLSEVIPNLNYFKAREQAKYSPRCLPLKP